jgi:3-oxoacyl-[acyl-carrier protein] reductase
MHMQRLTGRTAVVTGAGRGIGKAIAERFAAEGAKVAVISRTEANSNTAAEAINAAHPGSAKGYAVDVADAAKVMELGKQVLADFGAGVDIIVNNAGVTRDGLALRMSEEDWDTVLDTNLKGAFNVVKAFQRSILKSKNGRIINVASVIGLIGNAGQCNYAASKAGLIGFSKSLAREFAGRAITVNAIAPGFIVTDMTNELNEAQKEGVLKQIPLGVFGDAGDIANVSAVLASDEARYLTGQVLAVDGGMVM